MNVLRICVVCTFLTIFQILGNFDSVHACASGCTCTTIPAKDDDSGTDGDIIPIPDADEEDAEMPQAPRGRKVICANNPYQFSSIDRAPTVPLDTIYLDLSKNDISVLRKGSFNELSELQRLDLSDNKISRIEPGTFEGLHNLKRLDLSGNQLGSINGSIFTGLQNLQKLMLSMNKLNTIPEGTFNDLPALKRIDFQSDYLRCDCHLQWIAKWAKDKKVKIKITTTCAVPKELKGQPLKKLKKKDLHCDRPLELPLFEIKPGRSQIVFEGDKLPFECQASVVDPNTKMFWLRFGQVVETNRSQGIFVLTQQSPDHTIMLHSLVLEDLKSPHNGEWKCMVSTPLGNETKAVNIVVIDSNASQCEKNTTKTSKGVYSWDATVAGVTKELKCRLGKGMITHYCDKVGHWTNLNHSSCDFTDVKRRKLHELAEGTNSSKIFNDAKNLERLVSAPFQNEEDPLSTINPEYVNLASLAIYRLSQHASLGEEIVKSLLYSASKIMNISSSILNDAQRQRKSLSRIVHAVESIPRQMKNKVEYSQSADFIVMEIRSYKRQKFKGVQCSRLDLTLDKNIHRMVQKGNGFVFICGEPVDNTTNLAYMKLEPLTSIVIPGSSLHQPITDTDVNATTTTAAPDDIVNFQFIWYHNSNLFPVATNHHDDPELKGKTWNVVTGVISATLSDPLVNLTDPVELVFEVPETSKHLIAAYWDFQANGGFGDWRTDGCSIVDQSKALVTVHCDHLTAFAILEDQSVVRVNMFQMMEIVVYIGSCVCLLCLMAVIITYVSCFRFLNVPRKMKHSVINICVSVLLLIICFTMGIKRTDQEKACQIVGIVLHYLSLVAMFWFTVTSSNMLKKFTKAEKPPPPPIDLPMPLPPKPMIRFYLLAWGVPSIICGITAAVSFEFYDEDEYCFLEWEPGLGALIGPVGFLLLLNLFFFIRISCVIHSSTGPLLNLEETQELHITDIEMTSNQDRIETQSMTSQTSTKSSVSSVMDFERRPLTQLRALAAILVLYIVSWICGAIAVAKPFSVIPYQEVIFSYLYGVFCAILGLFMLIYYCLTRKDSRTSWKRFFLCEQQTVFTTGHIVENSVPQSNGHVTRGSGTDISDCNKLNTTVVTNHINHVKNTDDESSLNLVPSKPASLTDSSINTSINDATAAGFYNPRQNGVAKKFWEKKNKHNSKFLTKEMTKSLNINNMSESDSNFSGNERPLPRGTRNGYSSDGNTGVPRMNMDLHILPNGQESDAPSTRSPDQSQLPPSYNSVISGVTTTMYNPMLQQEQPPQSLVGSPNCSIVSYTSSQIVPHHTRTSSSSSLGTRNQVNNYNSAFSIVPPRNNTLPRQGKPLSPSAPSSPERDVPGEQMVSGVPSSVARLGDFDGSSQVSSSLSHERQRSPRPNELQYMSGYSSPPDGSYSNQSSMYKQYGLIDGRPVPNQPGNGIITQASSQSQQQMRNRTNSGGYSSDNSSRFRMKLENNFVQQVEQRIPQVGSHGNSQGNSNHVNSNHLNTNHNVNYNNTNSNHAVNNHVTGKPPISPVSDSDNNMGRVTFPDSDSQIHYKRHRHNDSDHNSEPTSQSHHKHSQKGRDAHKHSKHRGMTKQRSLDWDEQFKDKKSPSNSLPYAYVNHNYTERVLQKLTNMAVSEHIDPKSKAFWVPRSSSSYNEIVREEGVHLCEDSSTSSSDDDDDSLDNIWVLQKEKKHKKDKKETSV